MYYNESTVLYYDGNFVKSTEATTDLYGQTLHYGYGVFEGIRAYDTQSGVHIFKAHEHYERLRRSCETVHIPFNYNVQELVDVTYEVLQKNNLRNAYIRPLVFCSPNMSLTKPREVHIMICVWEWGAYLGDKKLRIMISSFCRPHPKSIHVEAKVAGHYVNSILATTEAKDKGYDEGLLLDFEGYLAEGPGANLFFERNGKLHTPQKGNLLPGITRATVMEICQERGIEVVEGLFRPEDLLGADSAFYCGTAAEVIGLESVNDQPFARDWDQSLGKIIQEAYQLKVLRQEYKPLRATA
jgi:branched-chain amino acid aminotransferase